MTVVRPQSHMRQDVGDALEMNVEQQILGQLTQLNEKVTGIQHSQSLMEVKLLGGTEGDTAHGRLPMVETLAANLLKRVIDLENQNIRWKAYAAAAAAIGGCAGSGITTLIHLATAALGHR